MTEALEGGEWSAVRPGRTLHPGKTRYQFYRRLSGPQGRSELAENLVPTEIRSRTFQPVAQSLYRLNYPTHRINAQVQLNICTAYWMSATCFGTHCAILLSLLKTICLLQGYVTMVKLQSMKYTHTHTHTHIYIYIYIYICVYLQRFYIY